MRFFFILILFIQFTNGYGQNERHLKKYFKLSPFIGNSHKLNKYAPKISKIEKKALFNKFANWGKLDESRNYGFWGDTTGVHFINLNEDDYIDVIYANSLGLDDASFYYGTKDSFRLVLQAPPPNFIKELKFEGKKCVEVILESIPYVGEVHCEMIYRLVNNSFELNSGRWNMDCSSTPSQYFKEPLQIKVKIDSCPLRENPKIAKGECFYEDGDEFYNKNSNIVGIYEKGSIGLGWAKEKDKNGILWILTEIPLKNRISIKSVYEWQYSENEYFIGWMQAEHLDILK